MPFIAVNEDTSQRVDITKLSSPKVELSGVKLTCQLCDSPMSIKASDARLVSPHFFHIEECNNEYKSHPESPEHRSGKEFVSNWISDVFANVSGSQPEKEVPVFEIKRVIDVVFPYPFGWFWANEVQLAKTTIDDIQQRTDDYFSAGIDVLWWLGKGSDTPAVREWCVERYGFAPYLIFQSDSVVDKGFWFKYHYRGKYGERKVKLIRSPHDKGKVDVGGISFFDLKEKILYWWKTNCFLRYFQTWNCASNDLLKRGVYAREKCLQAFNGKIGARPDLFNKNDRNEWEIDWKNYIAHESRYKHVPTLSDKAIEIIKKRANEIVRYENPLGLDLRAKANNSTRSKATMREGQQVPRS